MNKFKPLDILCRIDEYGTKYVVIAQHDDRVLVVSEHKTSPWWDNVSNYILVSDTEKLISAINNRFDESVKELESQLKSVKPRDYEAEKVEKQQELMHRIINITNKISKNDYTQAQFENWINEIHQLRKQYYSIKIEGGDEARKHNGNILYQIKKQEESRAYVLSKIDKIPSWLIDIGKDKGDGEVN